MIERIGKGLRRIFSKRRARTIAAALLLGASGSLASAHEYWLEAADYTPPSGAEVRLDVRNGQNFTGNRFSFIPGRHRSFEIIDADGRRAVASRLGDTPAVNEAAADGPAIVAVVTKNDDLVYDDFAEFESFLRTHGLEANIAAHRERGLPETEIEESYFRTAKALLDVGATGNGPSDRALGLPIELVVETPLHTRTPPEAVVVRTLYDGAPLPGVTVGVFAKGEGREPSHIDLKADEAGRVTVPLAPDATYLLNAVHLREPAGEIAATGAVWESLWASTTFSTVRD